MRAIQEIWTDGQCPLINGILRADGTVTPIELDRSVGSIRGRLIVGEPTSLIALASSKDVDVTFVAEMCDVIDQQRELHVVAGGGGMGGDGFVTVLRFDGIVQWIAFFDFANPFTSVRLDNESVKALNNLDEEWSFPIARPERLTVARRKL